jgi:hypothetical protein
MKKRPPDIQKQIWFHMLARAAAMDGKKLADAGKRREAMKHLREAEKWEKAWRLYGGKGPLT